MSETIPNRLYLRIGEVSRVTGIKPYILRYWESEFDSLSPQKSRSKQRLYRREDVELVLTIKDLLYNQGYTIAGARQFLKKKKKSTKKKEQQLSLHSPKNEEIVKEVRTGLKEIKKLLKYPFYPSPQEIESLPSLTGQSDKVTSKRREIKAGA